MTFILRTLKYDEKILYYRVVHMIRSNVWDIMSECFDNKVGFGALIKTWFR